jgi:hypothetical protein
MFEIWTYGMTAATVAEKVNVIADTVADRVENVHPEFHSSGWLIELSS